MKLSYISLGLLLMLIISCSDSNKASVKIENEGALLTYSAINSHGWASIDPVSGDGKGECEIVGGNIIYTKTDANFSGYDYCTWAADPNPPPGCSAYYSIDFSQPLPELNDTTACQ